MMDLFQDSGAEKNTTILLGAGASTTSGLPDWDELAMRLLVRSGSVKGAHPNRGCSGGGGLEVRLLGCPQAE